MKITGVGPSGTSATRRTTRSRGSDDGFARALKDVAGTADDDGGEDGGLIDGPPTLGGIDSLLALQAVNPDGRGGGRGRQRLMQRGADLLDHLEAVRRGLLAGVIPKDRLAALAHLVRSRRDGDADPQLAALLDEIELRAEVELAKLARKG